MRRRAFVRTVGAGSVVGGFAGAAGCLTRTDDEEETAEDETDALRVATYSSMVTGEHPAGRWLAETFEEEIDAELDWRVPEAGIDHFIRRSELDAAIGADVYLGLTVGELVRVNDALGGGLFEPLERDRLEHDDRIRDELSVDDPADRVLPFDTGYVTLVFDGDEIEDPPESFVDVLDPAYADSLLAQDPRTSDPGLAFLLWTIEAFGDDYLEYWRELHDSGVRIFDSWTSSYRDGYLQRERPMVVSYSTDRVGAAVADRDLTNHQIATLDGTGYENVEGVAVFADGGQKDLAYEFIDFLLTDDAQTEIAIRNAQFPAVEDAYVDIQDDFAGYAREPDESVRLTYDELHGEIEGWLTDWSDELEWDVETGERGADEAADEEDEETDDDVTENGNGDDGLL